MEEMKVKNMVDGLHTHMGNKKTSCNCFKWGAERIGGARRWGNLVNVQCKHIQNCHNESLLYKYFLIKLKKGNRIETGNCRGSDYRNCLHVD
jgi:hypothetical protein